MPDETSGAADAPADVTDQAPPVEPTKVPEEPAYTMDTIALLADQLMGNPAVQAAFKAREMELFEKWRSCEPADRDGRESIFHDMRALRALYGQLTALGRKRGQATRLADRLTRVA